MITRRVPAATEVVVPTRQPLETFHALAVGGTRTLCPRPGLDEFHQGPTGYLLHGWYLMTAGEAYEQAAVPCPQCFPPRRDY